MMMSGSVLCCGLCLLGSGCATITADFPLSGGGVAHVEARRFLVSSDVTIREEKGKVWIQYGAASELSKMQELLSLLAPLAATGALAVP